ncbi:MAG: NAD-dependent malic enzyme [Parachlamydiaceae bacterium]|nr:NAD-dependent malic enzyme [Parachlamydiaceae bacterium]
MRKRAVEVDLTGFPLITDPLLNKGTGFSDLEREELGLHGLLPFQVATIDEQRLRAYESFKNRSTTTLSQYINLRSLQDSNETLYYNLITHHIEEMMPIIYTPGVGEGCVLFSHIYRRPRGVFITYPNRDRIEQILSNPRFDQTEIIVVSDGERILGLGDQGAGGMGIPIGKLSLYTACAGVHPSSTLPILLDTGTDNLQLLSEPLYIGWRHERIRGQEYADFVEMFVKAIKKRFPHVLLQWEDFAQVNAIPLLETYRDEICSFNDDIQGTAAVATGTLLAAIQITKSSLNDQRFVVVGAGSAGCGICNLIMQAMIEEGVSKAEAKSKFFLIDRLGLLLEDTPNLYPFQKEFVQPKNKVAAWKCEKSECITLLECIRNVHPTVLIGVSGQGGIFTEEIIKEMSSHVERPIIFPLSNPTCHSEAVPADLMKWTNERVIMGTGSPFEKVIRDGKPFSVDQTNNSYIFPGIGLGVIAVKARRVTDSMFMVAAKTLANCSPAKSDDHANLLPPLGLIREVSFLIAVAVAKEAVALGLAEPMSFQDIESCIRQKMWDPVYSPYKLIKKGV